MSVSLERRLEQYCTALVQSLGHADRHQPVQWYMKSLMLPGERKSIEPMAAGVHPENVRSAHQAMHHLVADAAWDDKAVLKAVAEQVLPTLLKNELQRWWILDDTAHAKKGLHSVGVARQYSGRLGRLSSRFARVRVRAAHRDRIRDEEWLLIEWPIEQAEPTHYFLSTLPAQTPFKRLIGHAKGRWMIERDYQELKSALGLSHYEGRNWRGFHHHATLCIAAYGFLMRGRLSGKKNAARFKEPTLPEGFRPRGAGADAAPRTSLDYQHPLSPRVPDRSHTLAMSVLRSDKRQAPMIYGKRVVWAA